MSGSSHNIHQMFLEYSGAQETVQADSFVRNQVRLEFDSGKPLTAQLRDLRSTCCMIDIGHSIFTLAFSDVISCIMPEHPGVSPLVLRVRIGCLARDTNALLARNRNPRAITWQQDSWNRRPATRLMARPAIPLNSPADQADQARETEDRHSRRAGTKSARQQEIPAAAGKLQREEQRTSLEEIEKMLNEVW
jgi:hypothetical protein